MMKSNPLRKFLLITSLLTISLVATWAFDVVPYLGTITKFDARGYFGALKNSALTVRSKSTSVNSVITAPLFAPCGSVTSLSPPYIYIDTANLSTVSAQYVGYKICNDTGGAIANAWAKLNTSGAIVTLGTNEDGLYNIGPLAVNQCANVYFYVKATGVTGTTQNQTVELYNGNPTSGGTLVCGGNVFGYTVEDLIDANANKPDSVNISGDTNACFTVTATGNTGTIGSHNNTNIAYTPAADPNWPADAYELTGVNIVYTGGPGGGVNDTLFVDGLSSSDKTYTITYTICKKLSVALPAILPVTSVSSGANNNKYGPVDPATAVTLSAMKAVSPTGPVAAGAMLTYTVTVSNIGATVAATMMTLIDSIPANTTYVTGTTTLNSAAVADIAGPAMPYTVVREIRSPGEPSGTINPGEAATVTFKVMVNDPTVATSVSNFATYAGTNIPSTNTNTVTNPITVCTTPATPTISGTPSFCVGGSTTLTASGTGTYMWFKDTVLIPGQTANTLSVTMAGSYTVKVTDTNGCASAVSNATAVTQNSLPATPTISGTLSFCEGGSSTLSATGTGTFMWFKDNVLIAGQTAATLSVNAAGSYTVKVTDANSCASATSVAAVVTTQQCTDLSITKTDGSATYAAGAPITYTIVVSNAGGSNASGVSVMDTIPAAITGTTINCVASGTASCGTNASAGNSLSFTGVNINAGAANFLTITVSGTVSPATTGDLVNTATVTAGAGQTDPTPGNNSAIDTDTPAPQADLTVTKTDGVGTYTAGGTTTYTIVVANAGPSNANGVVVTDNIPTQLTSWTWACGGATGGATGCTAAASNAANFTDAVDLPANSSITYTVTAVIAANATGNLVNTVTAVPPTGTTDPTPATATDTVTPAPQTDLAITKTDGATTYTAGNAISYTIVVSNTGPSNATGASVADTIPAAITGTTINCVASGTASCGTNASVGNGLSFTGVNINAGASNFLTITVSGTVSPATTGDLVNTATVTAGAGQTDPTPGNNSATDTDTADPMADLAVQKNGPATVAAGGIVNYTIRVSNAGPSSANGAVVTDPFPAGLTNVTWTCDTETGGASCGTVNGTGNLNTAVMTLPAGGSVTYTVMGTAPASGSFINTATVAPPPGVTDPNSTNNTSSVTTGVGVVPTTADLAVVKSGPATVAANGAVTYMIVVTNAGPGAANGATFTDTPPLTGVTWTCGGATAGANCGTSNGSGNINTTITTLPAGASVTFTVLGTAPATGSLTNTATVAPPSGVTDPNPGNNNSTVTTTVQTPTTTADLYAIKTGPATVGPNATVTYKVIVGNTGPSGVINAAFADEVPSVLTGVMWTCGSATGGASCGTANGTGNTISTTIASLPSGSTVTYTITGTGPALGSFVNSATITPPTGTTDPDPTDNIGGPVITNVVIEADLAITKTDGSATYTPGLGTTYTIVVTNNGPAPVTGAVVTDSIPTQLTSWTWTCSGTTGGATGCNGVANSVANFSDTVNLPANSSITYLVTAQIPPSASGDLVNTVTVAVPAGVTDPTPGNNSATDTDSAAPRADLAVTKTDGVTNVNAGSTTTYTIVVINNGPSVVANAPVTDVLPAAITSATWACAASPGSSCGALNGTGNINNTVSLLVNGTATFTVVANISSSASGNLVNTAMVVPPNGVTDPTPGNNSATDTNTVNSMATPVVSIKVGDPLVCNGPGNLVSATGILTNPNNTAQTASFTVTLPAQLTALAGTCNASVNPGGCVIAANGSSVTWNGTLQAGQSVTIGFQAEIAATVPQGTQLCTSATGTIGGLSANAQDCLNVNCPVCTVPNSTRIGVSSQKAGSLLVFPYYISNSALQKDTRLNIANTGKEMAYVHLFFLDGASCDQADMYLCLTPNASFAFKASEYDPENTGFIYAVAVNTEGRPIANNGLIGNAFVRDGDYIDNYSAESFARNDTALTNITNGFAVLGLNGSQYDAAPIQLVAEIQSPLSSIGQRIVVAPVAGDLTGSLANLGAAIPSMRNAAAQICTGIATNEQERMASFVALLSGGCLKSVTITPNIPRVPNTLGGLIAAGQAGTLSFRVSAGVGLLMTPRSGQNQWHGIRSLHKTAVGNTSIAIPVFGPVC